MVGYYINEHHGLDGIPNTGDFGENDDIWQPGDGWIDSNNNGIVTVSINTFHVSYVGGYMAWGNVVWLVSMLYKVDWHWPDDNQED